MLDYEALRGTVLKKIKRDLSSVTLSFISPLVPTGRTLKFQGFLLETSSFTLNSQVVEVRFSRLVGFRGFTELQRKGLDTNVYRQLTLVLSERSNSEGKNELICVSERFDLS
jgi:hypothetical protein